MRRKNSIIAITMTAIMLFSGVVIYANPTSTIHPISESESMEEETTQAEPDETTFCESGETILNETPTQIEATQTIEETLTSKNDEEETYSPDHIYEYGDFRYNIIDFYGTPAIRIASYIPSTSSDGDEGNEEIIIPHKIDGKNVVCIGKSVFEGCKLASKITLQGGAWFIEDCAFKDTEAEIYGISNHLVKEIGDWAFSGSNIEPEMFCFANKIGVGAFSDCTTLTKIVLYGGKVIEEKTFSGCTHLNEVILPHNLEKIEEKAFANCKELKHIQIPKDAIVAENAFEGCDDLVIEYVSEIDNPYDETAKPDVNSANSETTGTEETVTEPAYKDYYHSNYVYNILEDGTIRIKKAYEPAWPDDLEHMNATCDLVVPDQIDGKDVSCIGQNAFSEITGKIIKIVIPESVKTIEPNAFENTAASAIVLPSGIKNIGKHAFYRCSSMLRNDDFSNVFVIPEGITRIEEEVFSNCGGLRTVEIPDSVAYIGERAFANSMLAKITIPVATEVEENAFEGCTNLIIERKNGDEYETTYINRVDEKEEDTTNWIEDATKNDFEESVKTTEIIPEITTEKTEDATTSGNDVNETTSEQEVVSSVEETKKETTVEITTETEVTKEGTTVATEETTTKVSEEVKTTKEETTTTTARISVGATKVKNVVKNQKSKKAKISLKKVSGAKYEVKISTTKAFGKKNTITKKVDKVTFTIKSKKIAGKKNVFVKARAYRIVNGKTYYGAWSKVKKSSKQ